MSHLPNNSLDSVPIPVPLNISSLSSNLLPISQTTTRQKSPRPLPTTTAKLMRDPNAWKEYERNIAQILSSTSNPELVDFPKDDVKINIIPRSTKISVCRQKINFCPWLSSTILTVLTLLYQDELKSATLKLPHHFQDMLEVFCRKWVQVRHLFFHFFSVLVQSTNLLFCSISDWIHLSKGLWGWICSSHLQ